MFSEQKAYLSRPLLKRALFRLQEVDPTKKRGAERTSALMYFLSFDMLCREFDQDTINVNPDVEFYRENRRRWEQKYVELVKCVDERGSICGFIKNLGEVQSCDDGEPASRISKNFFTVQIKRASKSEGEFGYPDRPDHLLSLGIDEWGVQKHEDWRANINQFLEDRRSQTPWTDLAIVLLRDYGAADTVTGFLDFMNQGLADYFSHEVHELFTQKLEKESRSFALPPNYLCNRSSSTENWFDQLKIPDYTDEPQLLSKDELEYEYLRLLKDYRDLLAS